MEKRILGRTGLKVSIIGFGGIKLSTIEKDKADEALNRAVDLGINFFDTARGYGDSENKIGRALSKRRAEIILSSKSMATTGEEMKRDIEISLKALQTEYLDLYLIHNLRFPEEYQEALAPGGALAALRQAQSQGIVKHIGFSSHRFLETMKEGINSGEFEVIMVSYNILNDELVDEEVMPLAHKKGMGVIAMKPLAGGALAAPGPELKLDMKESKAFKITAAEALRFVVSNPAITIAIPGMCSVAEVEENVTVGDTFKSMTTEEIAGLRTAAETLGKEFCRTCGYCQPCPQDIRIPVILRHLGYYKRYGLTTWAKGRYNMVEVKADACQECGECEKKCPYNLPVMNMLKEAHDLLG